MQVQSRSEDSEEPWLELGTERPLFRLPPPRPFSGLSAFLEFRLQLKQLPPDCLS